MHSFAISSIATLFFGVVASALPITPDVGSVGPEVSALAGNIIPAVGSGAENLVTDVLGDVVRARDDVPRPIAIIFAEAQEKISPLAQQITFCNVKNATEEVLTPISNEIKSILSGVASDLKKLVGQPLDIVLAKVEGEGKLTVAEVAKIVGGLIALVIGALKSLNDTLGPKVAQLHFDLLADVGKLLADVICIVITLVDGLLGALIPIVQTVVPAILNITGLSPLVSALNL